MYYQKYYDLLNGVRGEFDMYWCDVVCVQAEKAKDTTQPSTNSKYWLNSANSNQEPKNPNALELSHNAGGLSLWQNYPMIM